MKGKRINVLVLALEAKGSRCTAARGGLFGMQRGALETLDAFFGGSFNFSAGDLSTWCVS